MLPGSHETNILTMIRSVVTKAALFSRLQLDLHLRHSINHLVGSHFDTATRECKSVFPTVTRIFW